MNSRFAGEKAARARNEREPYGTHLPWIQRSQRKCYPPRPHARRVENRCSNGWDKPLDYKREMMREEDDD